MLLLTGREGAGHQLDWLGQQRLKPVLELLRAIQGVQSAQFPLFDMLQDALVGNICLRSEALGEISEKSPDL